MQTNLADEPKIIAWAYKELWMVEDLFRTMKSILETRPIYHKRDETIRGHVFCSFLALLLRRAGAAPGGKRRNLGVGGDRAWFG